MRLQVRSRLNLRLPAQQQHSRVPRWAAQLFGMMVGALMFLGVDYVNKVTFPATRNLSLLTDTSRTMSLLAANALSDHSDPVLEKAILNHPGTDHLAHGSLQTATDFANFTNLRPVSQVSNKETPDNEAYEAVRRYFWGKERGVVVELGAMDGRHLSVSAEFIQFHWHRVLIEASPRFAQSGPETSPDATFVHAAICQRNQHDQSDYNNNNNNLRRQMDISSNKPRIVHYVRNLQEGHDGSLDGIGEFMAKPFLEKFHSPIFRTTSEGTDFEAMSNWTVWNQAQQRKGLQVQIDEVPCLDLASLFSHLNLEHINFLAVNIAGAELEALQSIDWSKVRFDVLVVETEPFNTKYRPGGYAEDVRDYMKEQGYKFERDQGRNSWFRHPMFVPSAKPDVDYAARSKLKRCILDHSGRKLIGCRRNG